jgi:hypothetical protein
MYSSLQAGSHTTLLRQCRRIIAAGVVDTGGNFAIGISDTGGKFLHHFR